MYKKYLILLCALALTQCRNYSQIRADWQLGPFVKAGMKPVIISGTGETEPGNTDHAAVIRKDDKFYMLYSTPGSHISLAFSDDGTAWTSYSHNPVLPAEFDGELSGEGMGNPRLVVYQKVYYVYYTTRDGLCVATSTDLINWTRHGTVLGREISNGAVLMNPGNEPVKLDSQFVMYSSTPSGPAILYSKDLIHWELQNVKFDLPEDFKPAEICMALTDYHENEDHIMLFLGTAEPGRALISKRDPHKIIRYNDDAFLIPAKGEQAGRPAAETWAAIMKHKGKWWLWYGDSDHAIHLATTEE